jgi:hypothetical protein
MVVLVIDVDPFLAHLHDDDGWEFRIQAEEIVVLQLRVRQPLVPGHRHAIKDRLHVLLGVNRHVAGQLVVVEILGRLFQRVVVEDFSHKKAGGC